jgi:PIN domain nuclease of toxin-antitoxin system
LNALLDTQVFIWMDTDRSRLTPAVLGYFANPGCTMLLSVVSVWEMIIKTRTGKLTLRADVEQIVSDITRVNPLRVLPVSERHAYALGGLPPIHKDPFDRMLVAQAITEGAVLLTADPVIRRYPVRADW